MSPTGFTSRNTRVFAYACGSGCTVLVGALLFDQAIIAAVAKLFASSAFVLLALARGARSSSYGNLILSGLVLSWFGDAFLIGTSQRWFLLGLASFLAAHIAYVAAFVAAGIDRRWMLAAAVPTALIAAGVLLWLEPGLPPGLTWPVRTYTVVISLMVVAAFGTLGAGATPLIAAGACLFFLSDLSVAALRFTEPAFPTYVLGLPLYYAAQICFAFSSSRGPSTGRRQNTPPGNR